MKAKTAFQSSKWSDLISNAKFKVSITNFCKASKNLDFTSTFFVDSEEVQLFEYPLGLFCNQYVLYFRASQSD